MTGELTFENVQEIVQISDSLECRSLSAKEPLIMALFRMLAIQLTCENHDWRADLTFERSVELTLSLFGT